MKASFEGCFLRCHNEIMMTSCARNRDFAQEFDNTFNKIYTFSRILKGDNSVKTNAPLPEELFREKMSLVPAVREVSFEQKDGGRIYGSIHTNKEIRFVLAVLKHAFPARIDQVIKETCDDEKSVYIVIIAPYVSRTSADRCRLNNIGYVDYSGNCLISTDNIYISDMGHVNLFPKEDKTKNIFRSSSVITSKILRVLLRDTSTVWKIQELSKEVDCSIGMVSRVKEYICQESWASMEKDGLHIVDAAGLLREWSKNYKIDPEMVINAYSIDSIPEIEKKCSEVIISDSFDGCLTAFSGGVRYTPVVRYTKVHLWMSKDHVVKFMEKAGIKPVESGSNIAIYLTDSDDRFIDSRVVNGYRVASPVQTYLDCMNLRGRGEEMAEAIYSKEINK